MQLFRQQALDHQHRLHGDLFLVPPLRWQAIGWLLFGLFVAALLLLSLGSYTRSVPATGILESGPDRWRATLAVPVASIASIKPGQPVRITLPAWPVTSHGGLHGVVTSIGPARGSLVPVAIDIDAPGERLTLRPGLALRARILLGREPLWRLLAGKPS